MKNLTNTTLLCTLAFVSPLFADGETESVSLCCESRTAVTLATVQGALAGFGAYLGFHILANGFTVPNVSKHPYAASLCTAAGAVISGIWKYQNTPEKHFEFARKELMRIAQNELFTLLITLEPNTLITTLKDRYFREKLPLYTAFKQLDKICSVVDQCKDSLKQVLASSRDDLHQESNELQMLADMYLVILKDIFKQLKDDPNFINECNAGTLELMKEAQEAAAHAAQSSAFAHQMMYMANQQHQRTSDVNVYTQISI